MAFEKYLLRDNGVPKMSNHLLKACIVFRIDSEMSEADVLTQIEAFLTKKNNGVSYTLTTQETTDVNNLIIWVKGENGMNKLKSVEQIWALLDVIDEGVGFDNEAAIRDQMATITSDEVIWTAEV